MRALGVFRVINGAVMAPVFVLSVLVQYNDPDPVVWMAVYGAAAALCVAAAAGRLSAVPAAALAVVAGLWAAALAPDAVRFLRSDHEPLAFYMKTGDALEEAARECGGLLLVFLWSALLSVVAWRRARAVSPQVTP